MTKEELDALQALCDAATPGPWHVWASQPDVQVRYRVPVKGEMRIADVDMWTARGVYDADFIAAAREAVPKLIAEVRRLQAANDLWRKIVGGFYKFAGLDGVDQGDPWKVNETNGLIWDIRLERDKLHAENERLQDALNGVSQALEAGLEAEKKLRAENGQLKSRVAELESERCEHALPDPTLAR